MSGEATHSSPASPLVSVGLPVYNRPGLLRRALKSLTQQSYTNLEIIVSDDCSPGEETQNVIRAFMEKESRIRYYRQEKNIGAYINHRFVVEKAKGEYFFWASEDDEWHKEFVKIGIKTLLENPLCDAWCCTMNNIDSFGRVIREYPGFSRFSSTPNKVKDIVKYLFEPEIMGKSNIIHGIFRRDALDKTIQEYYFPDVWGSDYCFNLAFLTRFNLIGTDQVLHYKRVIFASECKEHVTPTLIDNPNRHIFPFKESLTYIRENDRAVRNTPYRILVAFIMILRLPLAIRNEYYDTIKYVLNRFFSRITHNRITRKIKRMVSPISRFSFYDISWRRKYSYKVDPKSIDVRWSNVDTCGIIKIPINILLAPIVTPSGNRLFTIEETPHYPWIKSLVEGNEMMHLREKYREYLATYYPEEDTVAGLEQVVALVSSFKSGESHPSLITIVAHLPVHYKGSDYVVIFDGVHRSAVAKAMGHEFIQCRLVSNRIHRHDFIRSLNSSLKSN